MKLDILNVSVVVLAEQHNPTILHPYFLRKEEIVPTDWVPAEPPLCTPGFSIVKYPNGVALSVEFNKFQVVDEKAHADPTASQAPEVAIKYIKKLPHVRYTSVGVNVSGGLLRSDAEQMLINQFLKKGPWNADQFKAKALGLRFVYPVESADLHLSCDAGYISRDGRSPQAAAVVVNGNYHTNLSAQSPLADAEKAILLFKKRVRHFKSVVHTIFRLEG